MLILQAEELKKTGRGIVAPLAVTGGAFSLGAVFGEYMDSLLQLVLKLADKHPQKMLNSLLFFGSELLNLDRHKEAITSYDQALKFKPDKDLAWYNRGIALGNLEHYKEAIASYDQALKLKPDDAQAWYNKACTYALQKNIDLTLENLKQAINLNPEYREMAKTDSVFDSIKEL